ncbi:hypothetical protein IW261DRAFT_1566275 [Armillaria novae-zelandiae]|uniref:Uncharacterized protein n=1 Tax=Armillaria novae-zelandiae TaxID=153914 RepID=A0AA39UCL1_9AGAR|nr:hypothetical protein IW261DRAFT_1566275 [Armillaria novae-zelandiae]
MAPSYVKSASFHVHEAATFVSSCTNLFPGRLSTSLTTDAWVLYAFNPIEWLEFQLVLWAAFQQIAVDDMCSSGEEYNFLVAEALKCGVTIDPMSR